MSHKEPWTSYDSKDLRWSRDIARLENGQDLKYDYDGI